MPPKPKRKTADSDLAEERILTAKHQEADDLVFEDPFGDEFEEEEFVDDDGDDEDGDDDGVDGGNGTAMTMDEDDGDDDDRPHPPKAVWRPGIDHLPEGEELEFDPSAYVMYHSLRTEWPCLSFDVMRDALGDGRARFPMSMFLVCGSQAERAERNCLTMLKLSDMHKTHQAPDDAEDNDDDDDEDDEHVDDDPTLEHVNIPHPGAVNRIRSLPQSPGIVATMADTGSVHIFDISLPFRSMQQKGGPSVSPSLLQRPDFTFKGHRTEGFALDWSPVVAGRLATGDCAGSMHVWSASATGSGGGLSEWKVDAVPYLGHSASVEDIQWSPSEATVFCSASADKTVKIWDTRGRTGPQINIDAHSEDVNVISWNKGVAYLLASGSDDGSFKVWDLRALGRGGAVDALAHFRYHRDAVTSIEWAPHDESVLCVAGADDQVTVWDLSVEAEADTAVVSGMDHNDFPPQLLFIHQGQTDIKEIHFHPQIPGTIISTAEDSFNVFKPAINVG